MSGSGGPGAAGAAAGTNGSGTAGAGAAGAAGSTAGTMGGPGTAGGGGTVVTAGGGGAGGATAGAGGASAAGAGGSSAAGAGGSGAGGTGTMPKMSAGCGKDPTDVPGKWNQHNIVVSKATMYQNRIYWTRVPTAYDKSKPMYLILWGQGCGQGPTPESIPPFENPAASAASIIVQLLAPQAQPNHCYSAGPDGDSATSPEIPYFDQVVSEVEAQFCIDTTKVFEGGYSSGGWESSLMSCVRANVLRGTGWAAAGLQKNHDPCMGPVAALITRGVNDGGTPLNQTMDAIESIRTRNGCGMTTKPWMPVWPAGVEKADTSSCVSYDGCMPGYPLIWCPTPGAHTNTEGDTHLTRDGLWQLWTTFQ
jgi:hypothetical protein